MKKIRRKPRPAMPYWYWLGQDGCWFCKNAHNCNNCPTNRTYLKKYGEKKIKGQTACSKKSYRKGDKENAEYT